MNGKYAVDPGHHRNPSFHEKVLICVSDAKTGLVLSQSSFFKVQEYFSELCYVLELQRRNLNRNCAILLLQFRAQGSEHVWNEKKVEFELNQNSLSYEVLGYGTQLLETFQ